MSGQKQIAPLWWHPFLHTASWGCRYLALRCSTIIKHMILPKNRNFIWPLTIHYHFNGSFLFNHCLSRLLHSEVLPQEEVFFVCLFPSKRCCKSNQVWTRKNTFPSPVVMSLDTRFDPKLRSNQKTKKQ